LVPGPFHVFACFKFQPHLPFVAVDCNGLVNTKTTKFAIKADMLINWGPVRKQKCQDITLNIKVALSQDRKLEKNKNSNVHIVCIGRQP
jgi:hypothetical protein